MHRIGVFLPPRRTILEATNNADRSPRDRGARLGTPGLRQGARECLREGEAHVAGFTCGLGHGRGGGWRVPSRRGLPRWPFRPLHPIPHGVRDHIQVRPPHQLRRRWRIRHRLGKKVAIKKIADAFADEIQAKMALWEVMLLRHMNHPNIVKLLDIIPPAHRRAFHDVYITSELIHIDMHKVIHSWTSTVDLSHDRCKHYLFQLLCGMKYLHSRNVLHRDLKPSNLLLSADGVLKICDFGQARTISKNHHKMTKLVGTLSYKAPEVLLHSSEYNSSIDVWSMDVIFAELILGTTLFRAADNEGQLGLILKLVGTPTEDADLSFLDSTAISDVRRQPHHPKQLLSEKLAGVDQLAANLIEKMLKFDPRQRITIQDAMDHPYFQGFHDPTKYPVCPAPSFEEQMSIEEIKNLIYNEALALNPEFRA